MIKIVDLQVGNIGSVIKAIEYLGAEYELVAMPSQLVGATKIILPGVGSFATASERMFASGFAESINDQVLKLKVPILGICVGMQLLAKCGVEGGLSKGLGYIDAKVERINNFDGTLTVPHVGWNDVDAKKMALFNGIENDSCFYFVHGYSMRIDNSQGLDIAFTNYGENIVAYVKKGNIYGAQFHPEKSQFVGLKFLRNFIELC